MTHLYYIVNMTTANFLEGLSERNIFIFEFIFIKVILFIISKTFTLLNIFIIFL